MTEARSNHFGELDAIRGIAALVVCLNHVSLAYPIPAAFRIAWDVPVNAHGAVVLFFVLSGFVLSLSWQRFGAGVASYLGYLVRRALRIVPALWLATAAAVVLLWLVPAPTDGGLSEWYHKYTRPLAPREIVLGFLVMSNKPIPPVWTIYIELFGSLAIPLFVVLFRRFGRAAAAVAIALLLAVAIPAARLPAAFWPLAYLPAFALGTWLALWPPRLTRGAGIAAIAGGLLTLTLGRTLYFVARTGAWQDGNHDFADPFATIVEMAGAVLLIGGFIGAGVRPRLLGWAPVRRLGDWSYSFYLIHFVPMRLVAHLLPAIAPGLPPFAAFAILLAATIGLGLLASALIFRWIELPGIALGKRLTATAAAPRAVPA